MAGYWSGANLFSLGTQGFHFLGHSAELECCAILTSRKLLCRLACALMACGVRAIEADGSAPDMEGLRICAPDGEQRALSGRAKQRHEGFGSCASCV